jgi:hypothetical protein
MRKTALRYRWYERERWPYAVDRKTAEEYARWLQQVPWRLFCTFTFAWKVSDPQADKTFAEFINRLEVLLKFDVGYVRTAEKRLSGCGKPACARHFHALLTSAAPALGPEIVEQLWMSMAGNRDDGAGAQVKHFDASQNGVSYVFKMINQDGDWSCRKLHLFPPVLNEEKVTLRMRRHLRRQNARLQQVADDEQTSWSREEKEMKTVEVPQQKSESQSVPALAILWQSRMKMSLGGGQKPLTPREFGQLKLLRIRLGDVTSEVVDWAMNNWGPFATKATADAGTGSWPAHPHIGFLLAHHAVALELHTIATTPAVIPDSSSIKATKPMATFCGEKKTAKEKPFKPTPAQAAKIMAVMETDGDLEELWAEIELENKNKVGQVFNEVMDESMAASTQ